VSNRQRPATHLLFLPRPALLDLCRRRPGIALGVITVLARRVRAFAAVIVNGERSSRLPCRTGGRPYEAENLFETAAYVC
jgi:hypothetical protein